MSNSISSRELMTSLVREDSSAFRLDNGKLVSDGVMTLRSGLNRVFGFGKSESNIKSNQDTIRFLLAAIEKDTNQEIKGKLLDSVVDIGDGKTLKLSERLKQGTYVSSTLVKQMALISDTLWKEHLLEESQRTIEVFLHGDDGQKDGVGQGYEDTIRTLCRDGTKEYPGSQKQLWDVVRRGLIDCPPEGRTKVLKDFEQGLQKLARQAMRQGRVLGEEEIRRALIKAATSPQLMMFYVGRANSEIMERLDFHDICESVREWAKVNDRPELENACHWLANELEQAIEHPVLEKLRFVGVQIKEFLGVGQDDKGHSYVNILVDLGNEIIRNHNKPGKSLNEILQDAKSSLTGEGTYDKTLLTPQVYDNRALARLMGNGIEPILVARKQKMDELNKEELERRERQDSRLDVALPKGVLPHLHALKSRLSEKTRDLLGEPRTAGDFLKPLLEAPLHRHYTREIMPRGEARTVDGKDKEIAPELTQEQQMTAFMKIRGSVGAWTEEFDLILPAIDRFCDFQREVQTILQREGGLEHVPPETLARLDDEARQLRQAGRNLERLGDRLLQEIGKPVAWVADPMIMTARDIVAGVEIYLGMRDVQRLFDDAPKPIDSGASPQSTNPFDRYFDEQGKLKSTNPFDQYVDDKGNLIDPRTKV